MKHLVASALVEAYYALAFTLKWEELINDIFTALLQILPFFDNLITLVRLVEQKELAISRAIGSSDEP